jgi:hypothetical protein
MHLLAQRRARERALGAAERQNAHRSPATRTPHGDARAATGAAGNTASPALVLPSAAVMKSEMMAERKRQVASFQAALEAEATAEAEEEARPAWGDMGGAERSGLALLGWTEDSWVAGRGPVKPWGELSEMQLIMAADVGYDEEMWEDERAEQLLVAEGGGDAAEGRRARAAAVEQLAEQAAALDAAMEEALRETARQEVEGGLQSALAEMAEVLGRDPLQPVGPTTGPGERPAAGAAPLVLPPPSAMQEEATAERARQSEAYEAAVEAEAAKAAAEEARPGWEALDGVERSSLVLLGWTAESWDAGRGPPVPWGELSGMQLIMAGAGGYDEEVWAEERAEQLLVDRGGGAEADERLARAVAVEQLEKQAAAVDAALQQALRETALQEAAELAKVQAERRQAAADEFLGALGLTEVGACRAT